MNTLSPEQELKLANHIARKPIEYIELYNELYDHYASTYESGTATFEATLKELDIHFDYLKVRNINENLIKKTKKAVNKIYWKEFKKFWQWPHITVTIGLLLIGFLLLESIPVKPIVWFVLIPIMLFNVSLMLYSSVLKNKNKYGGKKLKSAHYSTIHHFLNLPITLFNMSIFLPILFLESSTSRIDFLGQSPIIVLLLLTIFLTSAHISFKVFRTKISLQYL